MLYEKGLIKAMKEAYGKTGYSVAVNGSMLWICGELWFAGLHERHVSNDVKSVIALHFGVIPGDGEAMHACKGEEPNTEFLDNVLELPLHLAEAAPGDEYHVTPVRIGTMVVFQSNDLVVRMAAESNLNPIHYGGRIRLTEGWLTQDTGDSFVAAYSIGHANEAFAERIDLLEKIDWTA